MNQDKGSRVLPPGTKSVAVTSTEILSANQRRMQAVIRNTHATADLFLGYSSAITTSNAPIKVGAGDMWVEDVSLSAIYGIVSSGTVTAAFQEVAV